MAPVVISVAVEGVTDEVVARRLITLAGGEPGPVYGKQGKPHLRKRLTGYNHAARHAPWLVLIDLDRDPTCPPEARAQWLAQPAPYLCLRVVVHAIEAWLMADAEGFASFLGVPVRKLPSIPDAVWNPKDLAINLARSSKRKNIRDDMVPREGSGRPVGPAYPSRLMEFATAHWRPEVAAARSDSLQRAIRCLDELVKRAKKLLHSAREHADSTATRSGHG